MNKLYITGIFLIFFLVGSNSYSQFRGDNSADTNTASVYYTPSEGFMQIDTVTYSNQYNNSIGVRYSTFTGWGLSASRRVIGPLTIGVTGFFKFSEHTEWSDMNKTKITSQTKNNLYSFGGELRGDIITTKTLNIYVLAGGSISEDSEVDNQNTNSGTEINKTVLGLGFGFQWFRGKRFAFDINVGYIYTQTDTKDYSAQKPSLDKGTEPGISVGLQYFF